MRGRFSTICVALSSGILIWVGALCLIPIQESVHYFEVPEFTAPGFHTSMYYYDNQDFFQASVDTFKDIQPHATPPRMFVVNQHVLAAHLIAEQFAYAADRSVETVIVITQNNWNAGEAPVITSEYGWKTPLGTLYPNQEIIHELKSGGYVTADEDIFSHEHGITGIVPYVAQTFPQARIVPIVIRDKTPNNLIDTLAKKLGELNLDHTVIVGTIDMSHYLPKYVADVHDRLTLQAIQNFEYETLNRLDIDTAPTLRTLLKVAETKRLTTFKKTRGVNSATIVSDEDLMETTSYLTGYFSPKNMEEVSSSTTHVLFVGDMMFDRGVAYSARKSGFSSLLTNVERLFLGTHAVIGNLEGTITQNESISLRDSSILRFTFDPQVVDLLQSLYFTGVSLGNNHAYDFGKEGFKSTKTELDRVGIASFGSPTNAEALSTMIQINERDICFVGYHDLFTHDESPVVAEIIRIKDTCERVVVFTHWGDEYMPTENARQQQLAHTFIDAGADLIIGAHPHVVEPVEIYKNKAIFYSLGNFIFDQNFSYETTHGLTVHVEWNEEFTRFTLIPISIEYQVVKISKPQDRERILKSTLGTELDPALQESILEKQEFILWNNK